MRHTATIAALAIATLLPSFARAQSDTDKQRALISEVKKSNSYLFAETTMDSPEKASKTAMELLNKEIADYVKSNSKKFTEGQIVVARNTGSGTQTISLPRGNMYRAFAYVKKSDVLPSDNVTIVQATGEEVEQNGGAEVIDAQSAQKPAAPAIDPKQQKIVDRLLKAQTAQEALNSLNKMKREGLVTEVTSPTKVANPEEYILVVYGADNNISAVLLSGKPRINASTRQPDATSNYEYRGIIAVK